MRYLSLFSGIEAATQAWEPLGWDCVGVSEIEPFPCAVLEHHYPDVPNLGDVTKITEQQIKDLGQIDLIVFGSPCQNLSTIGDKTGFNGEQSSLFYEAMRIIGYARKHNGLRFALWENVFGAYSSNKGRDFAEVVSQMAGLKDVRTPINGWGKEGAATGDNGLLEWAGLDAEFFNLAARRKRVFALLDTGNWQDRQPILLEPESLRGDYPQDAKKRAGYSAVTREDTKGEDRAVFCGVVADAMRNITVDVAPTLRAASEPMIISKKECRRLTPVECERLMGFPDGYTDVLYKGEPCKDGVRYKALGNSMAVPVMAWIGRKISGVME